MPYLALILSLAVATPAAIAQDPAGENPKAAGKPAAPAKPVEKLKSLAELIGDSVTFVTFKNALVASGLEETLGTKGSYTVFAPTDEAFAKLPNGTLAKLMLPENKEKLRSLILYHIIAGQMVAADLKDGKVKTMNGERVEIDVDGEKIKVGDTMVFNSDAMASNGVMHAIGKVMVPESLDEFAGLED